MAKEEPEEETFGFWDNDPRTVPEHSMNVSTIVTTPSNITLLLGNTYRDSGNRVDYCKLRLYMSHLDFVEFAEDVRKAAELLDKIYKGDTPGPRVTSEEADTAWEEVYGNH